MANSSTSRRRGANVRVPPPLVFLGMALLGVVVERLVTDGNSLLLSKRTALLVAIPLAVLGFSLIFWAGGLFRKTGQDPRPWLETPELILSGIYRFTRNPMYVAMAILQTAIGVGDRNIWVLLLVPVSLTIVYFAAVRPEEKYLTEKFGDAYVEYTRSVRRWL